MFDIVLDRATLFALLGILVAAVRYFSYFQCLIKRTARPHVFSWFNWALIVGIGALAQHEAGGGPSVWIMAMVAFFCFVIAFIALFIGEKNITKSDWVAFIGVLVVIPIWQSTKDPLVTFALLLLIDVLSYWPTWRKMWHDPWSEPLDGFFYSGLRYFFALCAVPEPGLTTLVYPFWLMAADWGGGVYAYWRRKQITAAQAV